MNDATDISPAEEIVSNATEEPSDARSPTTHEDVEAMKDINSAKGRSAQKSGTKNNPCA